MQVKFVQTTRARLDSLAITNGQLIYLKDEDAAYYDLSDVRHSLLGVKFVTSLPASGLENVLYVVTNSSDKTAYIWNSTASEFVNVGGLYGAGSGLTLNSATNEFKADLLSETKLTADAVAATETAGRIYPIVLDHSGHLAVNVPWVEYEVENTPASGSTNIVSSGGIYTALQGKQDTLTIDATPTSGSTHVVESGGVYAALQDKEDTLTWDTVPTENSNNPVTSDGIFDALADKQDTLTFDANPTESSENPVKSGGVYNALADKQDVLTWDAVPASGSTNDVNSGAVYTALQSKQDTLTFDTVPTEDSTNPVESGGVYSELEEKQDIFQFDALPTAEASLNGMVIQYVGATYNDLVNGAFYRCQESETAGTYEWVMTGAIPSTGGHTIENASGTAMDQRTNLQFVGASVTDDSSNDKTVVTIADELSELTDVNITSATDAQVLKYDSTSGKWINATPVEGLQLGETESTAYRGDRGKAAYDHASDANKITTAEAEGLYKVASTADGHIASLSTVSKQDIVDLGIPAQDTTYAVETAAEGSTAESLVTAGEKYVWDSKQDALDIDAQPTSGSTNVVESGGVFDALADKMDDTPVDSTPASGSTNLVESGGVYTALEAKVDSDLIGVADGVASLDENGKVPAAQLPEAIKDVIEGYYNELDGKFYADQTFTEEIVGAAATLYIDLNTELTYRWSGTDFVVTSPSLALGETSTTAYRGDRGKVAYDFSQAPYTADPEMDGTASAGISDAWARGDHVHPSDTSKQDVLIFDTEPTSGSTNVLDSGAIYTALQDKQDVLDPDTEPTSGSTNVVTSGGVYTALQDKQDTALSTTVAIGATVAETVEGAINNVAEVIPATATTANLLATNSDLPTIDDALSSNSANPVENRVVKAAVDAKADSATTLSGYNISDAYTKTEVDNLLSTLETNITWKAAVATYSDIATTYPNPQEGWTVVTTDTNIAWRYSGGQWIEISANTIPVATTAVDGLFSTTNVIKLDGIEDGAQVNQNAFNSFKVGSDVIVANAATSTLEFIEGDNITITPDTVNDTVTIAAVNTTYSVETAAEGSTVESLVTAGEKFIWDSKQDELVWDDAPASGSTNAITSGAVYDAIPDIMAGATTAEDGTSGLLPAPTTADVNKFFKGDGTWASAGAGSVEELNDIGDVDITDVADGQVLTYDGTANKWVNGAGGSAPGTTYEAGFGISIEDNTISQAEFVGTQAQWDVLTQSQKDAYDFINITDDTTYVEEGAPGHAISDDNGGLAQREGLKFEGFTVTDDSTNNQTKVAPIPYTAGDLIEITNQEVSVDTDKVKPTFVGTIAEWNNLTAAQKAEYELVNLTDDIAGGQQIVVDVVQDGNLNAVTSNAVYDYIDTMITQALNAGY